MSRPPLPKTRDTAAGSAFFPSTQKEMNRLLDQFRSGFPSMDDEVSPMFSETSFPAIDVSETEDAIDVSAEVPGVKEDDLDVSISGQTLILKGTKSSDHEEKKEDYHLSERSYGSFRRSFRLPDDIDPDKISAKFDKGVMTISLPKCGDAKPKGRSIPLK